MRRFKFGEQWYKDRGQKGISKEQQKKVQDILDLMKRQLHLVTKADIKAQEMQGPRRA